VIIMRGLLRAEWVNFKPDLGRHFAAAGRSLNYDLNEGRQIPGEKANTDARVGDSR